MTVTAEHIARLRRMVAEPDSTTYTNDDLRAVIARYPVDDDNGQSPTNGATGANPPAPYVNPSWIPTYDLARAASEVWGEKAAALACKVDVSEDGQSIKLSQKYDHAAAQAAYWHKRRRLQSVDLVPAGTNRQSNEGEPWPS